MDQIAYRSTPPSATPRTGDEPPSQPRLRPGGRRRVVAALSGCGGGTGQGYRVDVIFDSAKGLLAGQLVKVAGARSGRSSPCG
ncbi:hypothetical protein GKE82_26515 [Conexibacter sp. W3-3-2]|uniref:hypothetical protein n=1 Tax=Conexibacter sp. W3-3-2 TaxID=2675227 RepID=UPI0012B843F8|nr:hypothetical protein [Conexibacter sp. W3-3-2]MTD47754.1 hypothetical protein [Conexibacter sp. W3-3-2]